MAVLEYSVEKPLNREPALKDLVSSFITEKGAYDRNHGPIPHIDGERHSIHVAGAVDTPLSFSTAQLKHDFPQHTVVCALQCAGNRRHTMRTLLKEVDGLDWGDGAVMNCEWRGPRLRDVLNRAGIAIADADRKRAHVAFACYATQCQEDSWYGASIELDRGMREDGDVILALEMNSRPLSVDHGYPVRVVAPGIAGARCVKWLDNITVQLTESTNFYQKRDYKILPPEAVNKEAAQRFWHLVPAVQDMPVNSVIAIPQTGETITLPRKEEGQQVPSSTVEVKGYALPGGEQGPITKVEVSGNGGRTWVEATIVSPSGSSGSSPGTSSYSRSIPPKSSKWAWALWCAAVKVELEEQPSKADATSCQQNNARKARILSRATDAGGNKQEESPQWNLRGVSYNGYGEARDLTVIFK
ncbi:MAG: hypothetical protein M1837_004208 [Sclerophora amabilis]|nr:MAG: hypothetical protein M1837_004208 [Sclerophora amabilis]